MALRCNETGRSVLPQKGEVYFISRPPQGPHRVVSRQVVELIPVSERFKKELGHASEGYNVYRASKSRRWQWDGRDFSNFTSRTRFTFSITEGTMLEFVPKVHQLLNEAPRRRKADS